MNNSVIFLTGGTGSFGKKFVDMTLKVYQPSRIIVYSRDEMKQWEMQQRYKNEEKLKFIIGDVRDKASLSKALKGVDYVIHAAATKIVPTAEYNPFECIKTNVLGAMNIIEASIENSIKKVVALSTDKASNPINLYGATKLASDKLFIASNAFAKEHHTLFSIVRYGNVMGSRGSVIPFFLSLVGTNEFPITDERMTRFMIPLEQGVELVWKALDDMKGGETYVRKIPSMKLTDIARAIAPEARFNIIGIRPGEKIHEQMISTEDAPYTYEYEDYYKILPMIYDWHLDNARIKDGKKVRNDFCYVSNMNTEWMSVSQLQLWLENNKTTVGLI